MSIKNFLLITVCTLIVVSPLIRTSIPYGDDSIFHLSRLISIAQEFEFPKLIYHDWAFDFGSPTGVFYPSLFLYPFALMLKFGCSIVFTYEALQIFTVILSAFCTFTAAKIFFKNETIATMLSIGYISTWYFQVNIFIRNDIGETLAMSFLPLALVTSRNLLKNSDGNWILTVVAYTGLIQSHILSTLIVFIFVALILLFNVKSIDWLNCRKIFLSVLGLNLFFIVPFIYFYLSVPVNISAGQSLSADTKTFSYVWSVMKHAATLTFPFIIVMFYKIISRRAQFTRIFIVSLSTGLFICFMSTENFPWQLIESFPFMQDFLSKFQFPWRFMCIGSIFLSTAVAISFYETVQMLPKSVQTKFISVVCILFSAYSITFGGHHSFSHLWNNRFGWFETRTIFISDDLESAFFDKFSLHPLQEFKNWKNSNHDPRLVDVQIDNGSIKYFYKSDEPFSAAVPGGLYYQKYSIIADGKELSVERLGYEDFSVNFPAGEGVAICSVKRMDSMYSDYLYRDCYTDTINLWRQMWDNGFDSRVETFERDGGNFSITYNLANDDKNILGNEKIELPIFNYPGFTSTVDLESSGRHLIQIDPNNLDSSTGTIKISYDGLLIFKLANVISLVTLIFLFRKIFQSVTI